MAIKTHAEQHEVKTVVTLGAPTECVAEFALVALGGLGRVGKHGVYLLGRDIRVINDHFFDTTEVGEFAFERNTTLVDDPQVRAPPRQNAKARVVHQALVERERSSTAGERQMKVAKLANTIGGMGDQIRGQRVIQVLGVAPGNHRAAQAWAADLFVKSFNLNFVVIGFADHRGGILAMPGRILPLP